jgi:MFS family permease
MEEHKLYSYRWAIVALFWLVIFAYGANWFALSPMLRTYESSFNIPDWEAHLLISLIGMFVIFFAWPAGSLIDKRGPKVSITIGALFMAIGFGIRPWLLQSFTSLMLSSVIAGIGLAWLLVALAPQMMRWFPARGASLPVGIAASGLFLGFGTGSLFMPIFNDVFNESNGYTGFLIFGILAIVTFLLWVALAKDHPATPPEDRPAIKKMKFAEGMRHIFSSRNAFLYPFVGFIIVGVTLVISAFVHFLYPGETGGYIAGTLLYGCAIGAFTAPFIMKRIGLKKVTIATVIGAIIFWLIMYALNTGGYSSILVLVAAFFFGFSLQASWPLALYSQETETGVTDANVGIAASLYTSISNVGAAVLPVIFPILFPFAGGLIPIAAILGLLVICLILWIVVRRKISI